MTNTGKTKGAEVAQVYIQDKVSSVMRSVKELKGFSKIKLEAGENKVVNMELPVSEWAFYDESSKQWKVEPEQFIIHLGSSSRDIKQQIPVIVK